MAFDVRRAETRRPGLIWVAAGVPALILAVLGLLVGARVAWLDALEQPLVRAISKLGEEGGGHTFAKWTSMAFSNITVAVLLIGAGIYFLIRREHRVALWLVAITIVSLAGNAGIKHLFNRARPLWKGDSWWQTGVLSFPSGHSAGVGALATAATLLTISALSRGFGRQMLIGLWWVIAVVVGFSRVMLGVHYPTDVIAGWCFGAAVTIVLWQLLVPQDAQLPHDLAVLSGNDRKRAAVILNPIKVGDLETFKANVIETVWHEGWNEPLWLETTVEDPGTGQAHTALKAGVDLIVVAGGDGTVRAVCAEAARTGVPVGVIPLGTGNLLARNMGLPLNTREAIDVAFAGQDRAIDLATFTTDATDDHLGQPALHTTNFLVMAGLGMDAEIMSGVDDTLKKHVGWFAYFVSGIKALRFPTMRVQISIDDGPFHRFRARTVVIGNVGFLQAGIPLLPQARLDDGLLDVVVLAPKRFIGWLAILIRVMGRTRHTNRSLNRMTGSKIEIRTESPAPMQLDGDPVGVGTRIIAEVHHGVLLTREPTSVEPVT